MAIEDIIRLVIIVLPIVGIFTVKNKAVYLGSLLMGSLILWAVGGVLNLAFIADLGALLFAITLLASLLLLAGKGAKGASEASESSAAAGGSSGWGWLWNGATYPLRKASGWVGDKYTAVKHGVIRALGMQSYDMIADDIDEINKTVTNMYENAEGELGIDSQIDGLEAQIKLFKRDVMAWKEFERDHGLPLASYLKSLEEQLKEFKSITDTAILSSAGIPKITALASEVHTIFTWVNSHIK